MKNKKILYLLTILLTLFSFSKTANAAQELTCFYHPSYSYALVQYKDGTKEIYLNQSSNANAEHAGWNLRKDHDVNFDNVTTISSGL